MPTLRLLPLAFLISTDGFQTFRSKERRLVVAAAEIVTARKVYRDVSPGTAKDFPSELTDLLYDPPMLACGWPRAIGVHCLSNERPKFSATLLLI